MSETGAPALRRVVDARAQKGGRSASCGLWKKGMALLSAEQSDLVLAQIVR